MRPPFQEKKAHQLYLCAFGLFFFFWLIWAIWDPRIIPSPKKKQLTRITAAYIFGIALNFGTFLPILRWFLAFGTAATIPAELTAACMFGQFWPNCFFADLAKLVPQDDPQAKKKKKMTRITAAWFREAPSNHGKNNMWQLYYNVDEHAPRRKNTCHNSISCTFFFIPNFFVLTDGFVGFLHWGQAIYWFISHLFFFSLFLDHIAVFTHNCRIIWVHVLICGLRRGVLMCWHKGIGSPRPNALT